MLLLHLLNESKKRDDIKDNKEMKTEERMLVRVQYVIELKCILKCMQDDGIALIGT